MITDVLAKLKTRRFEIEDELQRTKESATAMLIIEGCDFEYRGVGQAGVRGGPRNYFVFVGRKGTQPNERSYKEKIQKLKAQGYLIAPAEVRFMNGSEKADFILGKQYESGKTAVMDLNPLMNRNPVAVAANSRLGVFLDTKPELFGIVEEIAQYLGIEVPEINEGIGKTEVPGVFKAAFPDLF